MSVRQNGKLILNWVKIWIQNNILKSWYGLIKNWWTLEQFILVVLQLFPVHFPVTFYYLNTYHQSL